MRPGPRRAPRGGGIPRDFNYLHVSGSALVAGVKPAGDELLRERDELVRGLRRISCEAVLASLSNLRFIGNKAALEAAKRAGNLKPGFDP